MAARRDDRDDDDLADEISEEQVAIAPSDVADPQAIVDAKIPKDIRGRYEVFSYRNAAVILNETRKKQFEEILGVLRSFSLTTKMIRTAGGNESEIPKLFSKILHPLGWRETAVQGDLLIRQISKQQVGTDKGGKPKFERQEVQFTRTNFLDGHKIDYVKDRVAFDLEWNSKDQTFDRDLYAFSAFAQCGVVDAAVLVTRGVSMTPFLRSLGPALTKEGKIETTKAGAPRPTSAKYGASTTWMGKLLYRLNAGRNGGCPVLAIGITPE
ncbi:MAG TPA: BglII/BstYI family type II restriction endonuclease, partial [Rhizomicrobium sp.]|nr:BglII/BstYI family type II restriction endonuclease [Rhizomicrobium sp.]